MRVSTISARVRLFDIDVAKLTDANSLWLNFLKYFGWLDSLQVCNRSGTFFAVSEKLKRIQIKHLGGIDMKNTIPMTCILSLVILYSGCSKSPASPNSALNETSVSAVQSRNPAVLTQHNAVLLSVASSSKTVFVSYVGAIGNQCGLSFRSLNDDAMGLVDAKNLVVKILDSEVELKPSSDEKSVYRYSLTDISSPYGQWITIGTRDGRPLSAEFSEKGFGKVLLVSTPCKL